MSDNLSLTVKGGPGTLAQFQSIRRTTTRVIYADGTTHEVIQDTGPCCLWPCLACRLRVHR